MKYRKKPVIIEAIQWTGNNISEIKSFCNEHVRIELHDAAWKAGAFPVVASLYIDTLEGVHQASVGDYIIKGIKGEFYPCKPDIFHQTYEEV